MYLPLSHTGNIFPSWTVVIRRHHVYVREFHRPSCNSVGRRVQLLALEGYECCAAGGFPSIPILSGPRRTVPIYRLHH
jgi:hypothetical protein